VTQLEPLLISVVVPTYNRERYLKDTLDSILSQSYPHVECIVMDAGSTDGTLDLLRSYGERIQWRSGPDSGAAEAINKGWALSKGSVLAWLNADDCWAPGAAQFVADYLQQNPQTDVLYGACGIIDAAGSLVDEYPPERWDLRRAVLTCDHLINQAAAFMRREALESVGWLTEAWCHDHDLWLRLAQAGKRFDRVERRLADARIWPDNLGNQASVVIPAKLALTRRFFDSPALSPEQRGWQQRAWSGAYLRCIDYLRPLQAELWRMAWRSLSADSANAPRVAFRLVRRIVECTPPLYALHSAVRRRFFPQRRART